VSRTGRRGRCCRGAPGLEHDGHSFCREALEQALARFGNPKIFNSRKPVHESSLYRTPPSTDPAFSCSMDPRARLDRIFIERLWCSLKR
jgi:putative transposase